MKKIVCLLIACAWIFVAEAQISFQFLPEIYGKNVDGLSTFQIQNLFARKVPGRISITVIGNETRAGVVTVLTPVILLEPGVSTLARTNFLRSSFVFGNNAVAAIASQTRSLPPGTYSFCFHFLPADKQTYDDYENCFEASVQPLVPINLLSPAHLDTICQKRPALAWQPPLPYSSSTQFRL